jgi:hypothetical protein
MEAAEVTAQINNLAWMLRAMDASFEDRDASLLRSNASRLREMVVPLYDFLEHEVSSWRSAR